MHNRTSISLEPSKTPRRTAAIKLVMGPEEQKNYPSNAGTHVKEASLFEFNGES